MQWRKQGLKINKYKFYKAKWKKNIQKIKKLEQINKENEFKLKFFEDRNKELIQELKDTRNNSKTPDLEKLKGDKKRLLKKWKGLELQNKNHVKEIESFKRKIDLKNKIIKQHEEDVEAFKLKIKKFNNDVEEFKRTNAILSEAQRKDIDLENRQQQLKIFKLQNYIRELHK